MRPELRDIGSRPRLEDRGFTEGDQRQEALQRIQIGVIGLVSVLMLVSLANMILDRASDEVPVTEELAKAAEEGGEAAGGEAPTEPLAELGVTPAPAEEEGAPPVAGDTGRADQIVPDLEPDPHLPDPLKEEN